MITHRDTSKNLFLFSLQHLYLFLFLLNLQLNLVTLLFDFLYLHILAHSSLDIFHGFNKIIFDIKFFPLFLDSKQYTCRELPQRTHYGSVIYCVTIFVTVKSLEESFCNPISPL